MKTNFRHALLVSLAVTSVACAESNEGNGVPPDQITTDSGVIEIGSGNDSAVVDTSVDTSTPVSDAIPDGEACTFPETHTKSCGACGRQTRTCQASGVWSEYGACSGEVASAECRTGEKRTSACGDLCGTQTDFCDPVTCTWQPGFCSGEGPCSVGQEENTRASCTASGQTRIRTCDDKCKWSEFSDCGFQRGWFPVEKAPVTGRSRHVAVWTGTRMIVWGGYGTTPTYKADGASYDPLTNTWTPIAAAPTTFVARRDAHAVWTGTKMLVFGGRDAGDSKNDLAVYDPATDTWATAPVAPIGKRWGAASAWSAATNELLVWGGYTGSGFGAVAGDGAAYNPTTNTWTLLPAAPIEARGEPNSVWTGTEMLVFAGSRADSSDLTDGARFNPEARAWTRFSEPSSAVFAARYHQGYAWTGTALAAWGGITTSGSPVILGNGAVYTPMLGWSSIAVPADTILSPARRHLSTVFYGSGKLFVFSGIGAASTSAVSGMAAYDLAAGTWSSVNTANAPTARVRPSVVWTGREAILFGGGATDTATATFNDGGFYRP